MLKASCTSKKEMSSRLMLARCRALAADSSAARKRRALFTQLGEEVAHHFAEDEAPLELDEVRDLIEQIDQLNAIRQWIAGHFGTR